MLTNTDKMRTPATGRSAPLVSVVMPTYNGEQFLRPAIESILGQTFRDLEMIVVDDGSSDSTPAILREFTAKDSRLIVLTNGRNLGIAGATNRGLAAAQGEYIALQDHDDISLVHRFQTQINFLKTHPEIGLIGSGASLIDENGSVFEDYVEVADDAEIKWEMLFRCPISHTSVMLRRSVLEQLGGYSTDPAIKYSSDYDMLTRVANKFKVANLPEKLVMWRRHRGATCLAHTPTQVEGVHIISLRNIQALQELSNGVTSAREIECDYAGCRAFVATPAGQMPTVPARQVIRGLNLLCELLSTFSEKRCPGSPTLAKMRKRLYRAWGKHAVALAVRAPWDWPSRLRILTLGLRCLLLSPSRS